MERPFADLEEQEWPTKRDELIEEYPLELGEIRDIILQAYSKLCETRVGEPDDNIKIFEDVPVGAQTVGAFLETIIANEFQKRDSVWRQGSEAEKDIIHTENPEYSTELKMSGQVNDEIFGNRSYAQNSRDWKKKGKSGYYIAMNVHISEDFCSPTQELFLTRFGWIDFDDWIPQSSQSGQSAKLNDITYQNKLKVIEGDYLRNGPLELLSRVGEATLENASEFIEEQGISTVGEFVEAYEREQPSDDSLDKIYRKCMDYPVDSNIAMDDADIDLFGDTTQEQLN